MIDETSKDWIKGYNDGFLGKGPPKGASENYKDGYETGAAADYDPPTAEEKLELDRMGSSNS